MTPRETSQFRSLLAIANISAADEAIVRPSSVLLDVSSDPDHSRTVATLAGSGAEVAGACIDLVHRAVSALDLPTHRGAHPRNGVVDVLPFVPYGVAEAEALHAAERVAALTRDYGIPVFAYGRFHPAGRSLPALRRYLRSVPHKSHPTAGVVCIGIRDPLIAFNVNFRGTSRSTRHVARRVREPAIRALGFELASRGLVQVSMNLIEPEALGPREAFERVTRLARGTDLDLVDCEVVGLVPHPILEQLDGLPLRKPVRSIEQALEEKRLGG